MRQCPKIKAQTRRLPSTQFLPHSRQDAERKRNCSRPAQLGRGVRATPTSFLICECAGQTPFLVRLLDGRAGEADEARVRQGVAHVPGETVNEVVLGTVRFIVPRTIGLC